MAKNPAHSSRRTAAGAQEGQEERRRGHRPRARLVQQHHHHDHRPAGQRPVVGELRRPGLQGIAQVDAVRAQVAAEQAGRAAVDCGVKNLEVRIKGPGPAASPVCARSMRSASASLRSRTSRRCRTTAAGRRSGAGSSAGEQADGHRQPRVRALTAGRLGGGAAAART